MPACAGSACSPFASARISDTVARGTEGSNPPPSTGESTLCCIFPPRNVARAEGAVSITSPLRVHTRLSGFQAKTHEGKDREGEVGRGVIAASILRPNTGNFENMTDNIKNSINRVDLAFNGRFYVAFWRGQLIHWKERLDISVLNAMPGNF